MMPGKLAKFGLSLCSQRMNFLLMSVGTSPRLWRTFLDTNVATNVESELWTGLSEAAEKFLSITLLTLLRCN